MPTAVTMPPELREPDFATLVRQELDARVRIRLLALWHLQEGKTPREVGAMLKVHEKTVLRWLRRFRASGIAGLAEQPGRGAKRRLGVEQEPELKALIDRAQAQRSGGSLTGEEIRSLVAEQFGVTYSLNGLYNLLHRAGLSWISARSKHPRRDPDAQAAFKKTSPFR